MGQMENTLQTVSQEMLPAVEAEMKEVLQVTGQLPDTFFGMMQYHMGWVDEQFAPAMVKSGKRIRPLLLLLICQAAGGRWEQAVPAAAAVELLHNFSLIHDDIEDDSPTRRGRQTLWKIWGMPQAINAGDAMFALAHTALGRLSDRGVAAEIVVQVLRRFDEMCLRLTQGQHADMNFERQDRVSVEEYLEMITGKTAVLLSFCCEAGALVAGRDAQTVHHYNEFGRHVGLAFQVIDDILGIWGDEIKIGKSASTDILTKKKTLPVLYGLSHSDLLRHLYASAEANDVFVQQVVSLLNDTGANNYANDKATYYSQTALGHLESAQPTGPAYTALNQLTDMLLKRDF